MAYLENVEAFRGCTKTITRVRNLLRTTWIGSMSLAAVCGVAALPGLTYAIEAADVKDIPTFVECLNDKIAAGQDATVADTVQCLPPGCRITLTMSSSSAQPAC